MPAISPPGSRPDAAAEVLRPEPSAFGFGASASFGVSRFALPASASFAVSDDGFGASATLDFSGCGAGSTPCGAAAAKRSSNDRVEAGASAIGFGDRRRLFAQGRKRIADHRLRFARGNGRRTSYERCIEIGAAERRIDIGAEDIGCRQSRRCPAPGMRWPHRRENSEGWISGMNVWIWHPRNQNTHSYYNSSALHPDWSHLDPLPGCAPMMRVPADAFERSPARDVSAEIPLIISQRCGASLRRLLVKCGLSRGGCWAWLTHALFPCGYGSS